MNDIFKENALMRTVKWGEWSLIALFISVLSGILVAFQYDPATPLYSAGSLDLLVPFGDYFRSLHFYSSQLFFLLTLVHLWAIFERAETYSRSQWIRLTATLPVALLILFTGYILRADSTGASAGLIAENIITAIPGVGKTFNDLLFSITDDGMKRVYVNHVIGFGIVWGILIWEHLRKYRTSFWNHPLLTAIILLCCLLTSAPFEPEKLGVFHISGPWFFLGLQELLRFLPPLLAGVIFPSTLLLALFFLQRHNRYYYPRLLSFILGWLGTYTLLTVIALCR
ncbi:MAG: cytochrome b N-terminal domain-containing protein [Proteobacteria bacterium]|nr:cytochrome b N-terminal domain-containing protein [Pseudomonadota bacterium]MBU1650430.1 cytochrome b N-terminal domain-containing protein [Pseudomonadota bacterium]MBU1985592.1 cytochrome b N-terminal domain-containing protein [Pseudomonadota bacterium]